MNTKTAPDLIWSLLASEGHLITLEHSCDRVPDRAAVVDPHECENTADARHEPIAG